ncbi:MAG TPA: ankyrin repeat domain-containing protein [Actinomycetales bacterium]|nr:ankyrin repeat domain-containing protein [Actinomycetales bacterium]
MSAQDHDVPPGPDDGARTPREGVDDEVLEFAQMLFQLARDGETERLLAYIDAGVTPDLTNERGDAFLMLAAYNGHPETVRALLGRGAEVDRANDRGQTPLAGAVFKGYGEIVRALYEAGADPYAGTPSAVDAARMFEKDAFLELFGV